MIIDGRDLPTDSTIRTDVCIVGSGPAGMAVALRLGNDPHIQVCMLESGGVAFDEFAQSLNRGDVVDTPYFPLESTRIRALGGTTMAWGGICVPLERTAFESRPWVSDVYWPVTGEDIEPYLDEAFSFCGITAQARARADSAFRARCETMTLDPSVLVPTQVYFGRPDRLGEVYRDRFRESHNVTVYLHSTVVQVLTNESEQLAKEVVVRRSDGTGFRVFAGYFVLATGGIENARLLMSSFREGSQDDPRGIRLAGRFFMEHPRYVNRFRIRSGATQLSRFVGRLQKASISFVRLSLSDGLQRARQLPNYHANLFFGYLGSGTPEWNAKRRVVSLVHRPWCESPYSYPEGELTRLRGDDVRTVLIHPVRTLVAALSTYFQPSYLRRYLYIASCIEQHPDWRNRLELLKETDSLGMPKIRIHWRVGAEVERTYREGLELVLSDVDRIEPGIRDAEVQVGEPYPHGVFGTWHHIGTTRMHREPTGGVVDESCKVHGLDNLYVAGSSVFPTAGTAAPTITIVQLAMRLADHLTSRLRSGTAIREPSA